MKPDRVVVGVRRAEVGAVLGELYAPFLRTEHRFLVMSPESAELTKYVVNALLATKISFIISRASALSLVFPSCYCRLTGLATSRSSRSNSRRIFGSASTSRQLDVVGQVV